MPRRLYRSTDHKFVAGVAGGLAEHLRLDPLVVRLAFAVLTITGGIGALAYGAFWVVVPQAPSRSPDRAASRSSRAARVQLPAIAAVTAGGMIAAGIGGVVFDSAVAWALVIAATGIAIIWRQADEAQRRWWTGGRGALPRLALGALLLVGGGAGFLAATDELEAAREGIVAIVVVLAGTALIFGPWWLRLVTELTEERRERIRSQERAELAAHVHDSVLQTLTLIQRRAADPRDVQRLARAQERELRAWLYGPPVPEAVPGARLGAALEAVAAEVEDLHDVRIDVVTVGDADVDERLHAVVLAAREAMVNAAKFSGEPSLAVYAEVEPERVTVFVRDTGAGFDPTDVPADRRGVAESIVGRVDRAGGTAAVRSTPGTGTEIELTVPR